MDKDEQILMITINYVKRLEEENEKLHHTLLQIKKMIKNYCDCCKQYEPDKRCNVCMYKQILKQIKEVQNGK